MLHCLVSTLATTSLTPPRPSVRPPGIHIINLRRTYEKLLLAARAIVAVENPADVYAISARPWGQRAVLKYAHYTGATPIAGRFTPGCFTNQIQVREGGVLVWGRACRDDEGEMADTRGGVAVSEWDPINCSDK